MPQEQRESKSRQTVFARKITEPLEPAVQWILRGMGSILFVFVMIWQGKDHIFSTHEAEHTLLSTGLELAPPVVLTVLAVSIVMAPERTMNWFFGLADKAVGKFFPAKERRDDPPSSN